MGRATFGLIHNFTTKNKSFVKKKRLFLMSTCTACVSSIDMSHGEYGVGLYFSQRPSKAAHFSAVSSINQIIFKVVLFSKQYPTIHRLPSMRE